MAYRGFIFAGAGASKAVNQKKYPTTVEFFKNLPSVISGDKLFYETARIIKSQNNTEILDIEQILWELQSFSRWLGDSIDDNGYIGKIISDRSIDVITEFSGLRFGNLRQLSSELKAKVDLLIRLRPH